ncbi:MAG TPA: sodium:proton antiporter, partial [Flavobacteriales bacterium]|nr:sodium:proton antiporter [Flavobacteriales bacterium]
MKSVRPMSLLVALVPIIALIAMLAADVVWFGEDSSYGSNQMALLIAALIAGGIGVARGTKWEEMREAIASSIGQATEAILILLLIGALAGTWLLAGIIPAFIHYGLLILQPGIFLFAACVVCAVLSLATGSSWGTVGTVGVALIGIGTALGLEEGWIAGAIISGAYFGDKLSPLSDTTNLAPAVAGTDLITHIKYMTITTIPSFVIALIV